MSSSSAPGTRAAGVRTATAAGLLGLLLGLGACGEGAAPAPARQRLQDLAGRLLPPAAHESGGGPGGEPLLAEDFAGGSGTPGELPAGWTPITDPRRPLEVDRDAFQATVQRSADGESRLTLRGRRGALYRVLAVEPEQTYLFSARVRASGLTPQAEGFTGAGFWLGEYDRLDAPGPLLRDGRMLRKQHGLPGALSDPAGDWVEVRRTLRTEREARAMVVGCVLSLDQDLPDATVDFADLRLERVAPALHWEELARAAVLRAGHGMPPAPGWSARRSVGAMLGGEYRPALLLLPGERLRLSLRVPAGGARLETGLGAWPAARGRSGYAIDFQLRVGDEPLASERVDVPAQDVPLAWKDVELDLNRWSGRTVELELGLEGPWPGLFGAPQVRSLAAAPPGWNVVLVSIDTLRADRLGAYGRPQASTPELDALAARALLFEDVSSQAPYTLPSHASLFTGQYPPVHGVEGAGRVLSSRRSPLLARLLAQAGWRTQAFTAGAFLSPEFGFEQGFDGFTIVDPLRHQGSSYFDELRRNVPGQLGPGEPSRPGTEPVLAWLEAHRDQAFFLFLHTYEVHDYDAPAEYLPCARLGCPAPEFDYHRYLLKPSPTGWVQAPISDEHRAHLEHRYDGALAHVDHELGRVFAELERLGIAGRTIVAVTSDHGEELFERGHLQHGKTLYEEQTRIPLLLRVPGLDPARLAGARQQVDLAPTLLRLLGLPADGRMQGGDLLRRAAGPEPVWSGVNDTFSHRSALRDERGWKLIHAPAQAGLLFEHPREWELYELGSDPAERRERSGDAPEELARLRARLQALEAEFERLSAVLGTVESGEELSEETRRMLDHMGYGGFGD